MIETTDTAAVTKEPGPQVTGQDLYKALARYEQASIRKATWQLLNTLVPFFALWAVMIYMVRQGYSYWITLGLAMIASVLLVRIFIFFHDCGHGSFFASHRANRILGYVTGLLTFTPYEDWQREHATHHATSGDLDRRGHGDIWTLTIEEYRAAPLFTRLYYRAYRNPLVMFGIGPAIIMLVLQRFWHPGARKRERSSVIVMNIAIVALITLASLTIGFKTYVIIQLPILLVGGALGIWLFYVQHQYEGVDWVRHDTWDQVHAAVQGSSYYKLPKVVQWCTGNIGLHHIHHVRPGIPNYNLQKCCDEVALMQQIEPLTFRKSLRSLRMNLWDEKQHKLVSFRALRSPA